MRVGFHVSIKDGVDHAVERAQGLGCATFQIFTRSPRMWKYRELREAEVQDFKDKLNASNIKPVFSHMPYLPNLSTPNPEMYLKSVNSLKVEVERSNILDVPYLVTHLGSHLGSGQEAGMKQIVSALNTVYETYSKTPVILLENTSGKRNEIGSSFQELKSIIDAVSSDKIGVCFDTCHGYTKGYDIKTSQGLEATIQEMEETIGFDKVHLIHLNDSKGELGSKIDRHDHIGMGQIGENGFRNILTSRLVEKPMIMETPLDERRTSLDNMRKVHELAGLDMCE
ncbi:MAG: deoxyribonuclease IV [Candidatus Bathyarchaeota archaeon]|nr:deoxyribonuclease IV [Candidatus Bathyarchaeota archaeon]